MLIPMVMKDIPDWKDMDFVERLLWGLFWTVLIYMLLFAISLMIDVFFEDDKFLNLLLKPMDWIGSLLVKIDGVLGKD